MQFFIINVRTTKPKSLSILAQTIFVMIELRVCLTEHLTVDVCIFHPGDYSIVLRIEFACLDIVSFDIINVSHVGHSDLIRFVVSDYSLLSILVGAEVAAFVTLVLSARVNTSTRSFNGMCHIVVEALGVVITTLVSCYNKTVELAASRYGVPDANVLAAIVRFEVGARGNTGPFVNAHTDLTNGSSRHVGREHAVHQDVLGAVNVDANDSKADEAGVENRDVGGRFDIETPSKTLVSN